MEKYDVFISCKSEDYKNAEEVYDFLMAKGFQVFLASRELRRMGDAEYGDAIDEALDVSEHMIVLCSNVADVKRETSPYVYYEWSTFNNEQRSGRKDGNIITILNGVNIADLPIALRKVQSLELSDYKDKLPSYVETPEYHKRKALKEKEQQEREKQEALRRQEEEKRRQEEQLKQQKQAKTDLIQYAEEYHAYQAQEAIHRHKITDKMQFIGITERTCPVCQANVNLGSTYCPTCGWTISPIEGIKDVEYLLAATKPHLAVSKSVWQRANTPKEDTEKIEKLQKEIKELQKQTQEKLLEYERNASDKKLEIDRLQQKLYLQEEREKKEIDSLQHKLNFEEEKKKKEIDRLQLKLDLANQKYDKDLKSKSEQKDKEIERLRTELINSQKRNDELLAELNEQEKKIQVSKNGQILRVTPARITNLDSNEVFVFGTDPLGQHSNAAAVCAVENFGAKIGCAEGLSGKSYAIPFYGAEDVAIVNAIKRFISYATRHSELQFFVTAIGSTSKTDTPQPVKKLFEKAKSLNNVYLPKSFWFEIELASKIEPASDNLPKFETINEAYEFVTKHCHGKWVSMNNTIRYIQLDKESLKKDYKKHFKRELPEYDDSEPVSALVNRLLRSQR